MPPKTTPLKQNAHFAYHDDTLHCEEVDLNLIAETVETPCFVYSAQTLRENFLAYHDAFSGREAHPSLICYAMKANSNLSILRLFAELGAGFDIVSQGELQRALSIGADPKKIVFSGVGKSVADIRAALDAGIACFNVESASELERISTMAKSLNHTANISLRVNPDVDAQTHPYISTGLKENKFGIDFDLALALYRHAKSLPNLNIVGIDCHIGSQLTSIQPFTDALHKVIALIDALAAEGIILKHVDIGGGIGICYQDETPININDYAREILAIIGDRALSIMVEPGRSLVGNAGVLLTKVEYLKSNPSKNFAIIDAAMNDLMRPALYDAWHDIVPIQTRNTLPNVMYDIVGPVCESGDFLGKNRPLALCAGDRLAVLSAGAYGMTMASNYNTRPRAAEVLVQGSKFRLIKTRETIDALLANEISCLHAHLS